MVIFDNDEAGRIFTRVLRSKLDKHIIISEVTLPRGRKDMNECSKEEFDRSIQQAANSSIEVSYNIKNLVAKLPRDTH